MRDSRLALLVGAVLLLIAAPVSATPTPVPPFSQCPTVGMAHGCAYLFVLGTNGGTSLLFDSGVKHFGANDDVLVGIPNNWSFTITSFTVTGKGIGNFDGDGPFAKHSYDRPGTTFSGMDHKSLTINFPYGLGNGASAYFVLNGSPHLDDDDDHDKKSVVPEPSSIVLIGGGLVALGGFFRRRMRL